MKVALGICRAVELDQWPFTYKTIIEIDISDLYPSFGTFCVQIGQFLEAQWAFEKCLKAIKLLFLMENEVDIQFFWKFKMLPWLE